MAAQPRILAFAGSARKGSFNQLLLNTIVAGARAAGGEVTAITLRDYALPLYDGDLEDAEGIPAKARELRQMVMDHDALLLVSPEYNSSLPALLKNTLDWISRPEGDLGVAVAYRGKVAALASASPSALGGLRGLVALRSMLGNIGVTVLPDQVTLGQAQAAFAADGTISDARKRSQAEALGRRLVEVTAKLKG